MKTQFLLLVACLLGSLPLMSQKQTLSGYVRNASNGETLIGATVFVQGTSTGTFTNEYGFYSISIPAGTYTFEYAYLGFETLAKTMTLNANTTQDIEMVGAY